MTEQKRQTKFSNTPAVLRVLLAALIAPALESSAATGAPESLPRQPRLITPSTGRPGDLDLSFDPGPEVDGAVRSIAVQTDGKIVIGGDFTTAGGLARWSIARLNADGSADATFKPELSSGGSVGEYAEGVHAIALQADGKMLIGGGFITVNAINRRGIARLNADGSLDGSFDTGTGLGPGPWIVNCLALQADGKVLLGGSFTSYNDANCDGLVRLNPDQTRQHLQSD